MTFKATQSSIYNDHDPKNLGVVTRHSQHANSQGVPDQASLTFQEGRGRVAAVIHTGIIDLLSSITITSPTQTLFTDLRSSGISSEFIEYLSECQEKEGGTNTHYCLPHTEKIIFIKRGVTATGSKTKKGQLPEATSYTMVGGHTILETIKNKDCDFFPGLVEALKRGLCKVNRLDLCCDLSHDIMYLVSANVQRGRVSTFNARMRGWGTRDGVAFANESLGKQSLFYQSIAGNAKLKPEFKLHSLYIGHPRKSRCVLHFYDKKKQASEREHRMHMECTRIEVRIYGSQEQGHTELMHRILEGLTYPSWESCLLLHCVFAQLLFSHVHFSNRVVHNGQQVFGSQANWARWWGNVLKICFLPTIVHNQNWDNLHWLIIDSLKNFKKKPLKVLAYFEQQLTKIKKDPKNVFFRGFHDRVEWAPSPLGRGGFALMTEIEENGFKGENEQKVSPKRGRPKGSKDSQAFSNRGRPFGVKDSRKFPKRGRPRVLRKAAHQY